MIRRYKDWNFWKILMKRAAWNLKWNINKNEQFIDSMRKINIQTKFGFTCWSFKIFKYCMSNINVYSMGKNFSLPFLHKLVTLLFISHEYIHYFPDYNGTNKINTLQFHKFIPSIFIFPLYSFSIFLPFSF